jgi:hypothetical protein
MSDDRTTGNPAETYTISMRMRLMLDAKSQRFSPAARRLIEEAIKELDKHEREAE